MSEIKHKQEEKEKGAGMGVTRGACSSTHHVFKSSPNWIGSSEFRLESADQKENKTTKEGAKDERIGAVKQAKREDCGQSAEGEQAASSGASSIRTACQVVFVAAKLERLQTVISVAENARAAAEQNLHMQRGHLHERHESRVRLADVSNGFVQSVLPQPQLLKNLSHLRN
jgi:hypothetical protein